MKIYNYNYTGECDGVPNMKHVDTFNSDFTAIDNTVELLPEDAFNDDYIESYDPYIEQLKHDYLYLNEWQNYE
jgi:hypothetical protein